MHRNEGLSNSSPSDSMAHTGISPLDPFSCSLLTLYLRSPSNKFPSTFSLTKEREWIPEVEFVAREEMLPSFSTCQL